MRGGMAKIHCMWGAGPAVCVIVVGERTGIDCSRFLFHRPQNRHNGNGFREILFGRSIFFDAWTRVALLAGDDFRHLQFGRVHTIPVGQKWGSALMRTVSSWLALKTMFGPRLSFFVANCILPRILEASLSSHAYFYCIMCCGTIAQSSCISGTYLCFLDLVRCWSPI